MVIFVSGARVGRNAPKTPCILFWLILEPYSEVREGDYGGGVVWNNVTEVPSAERFAVGRPEQRTAGVLLG